MLAYCWAQRYINKKKVVREETMRIDASLVRFDLETKYTQSTKNRNAKV